MLNIINHDLACAGENKKIEDERRSALQQFIARALANNPDCDSAIEFVKGTKLKITYCDKPYEITITQKKEV